MGKAAMKILELKDEEFYEGMGVYFVQLAQDLGYGLMLQSVGRNFRDFFVNLDNLQDLNSLFFTGLFINDLSMHDYSRDIMLATTQEMIQMKMLLAGAEKKAEVLEAQTKKVNEIKKKSDDLISQMLPKNVADDL